MSQDNGQPPGEAVQPPEGLRIPRAFSLVLTVTPFVGATLILLAALLVGMPEFRNSLTYDPRFSFQQPRVSAMPRTSTIKSFVTWKNCAIRWQRNPSSLVGACLAILMQ